MTAQACLSLENNILSLSGQIHFDNVMQVCEEGQSFISGMESGLVDLQKLDLCDSSILALCIAWQRLMQQLNKTLVFINLPPFIQDLIRVHGLDSILSIRLI